jgi:hypothetical protein
MKLPSLRRSHTTTLEKIMSNHATLMDLLVDNDTDHEPIFCRFVSGLEDKECDPAHDNSMLLRTAVKFRRVKATERLLVDPRVNPADWGNAALLEAHGSPELQDLLMADKRVTPDEATRSLQRAILSGDIDDVKGWLVML